MQLGPPCAMIKGVSCRDRATVTMIQGPHCTFATTNARDQPVRAQQAHPSRMISSVSGCDKATGTMIQGLHCTLATTSARDQPYAYSKHTCLA
jgi:hypothetical protein